MAPVRATKERTILLRSIGTVEAEVAIEVLP
jgi:hypothetical protein